MSVAEQLLAGLELTLVGMVTVFALLSFMVLVIQWMSRFAHRLQPPGRTRLLGTGDPASGALDPTLISAITAAIHRYRQTRR